MILVDTSVWIDHFRYNEKRLLDLLDQGSVLTHPLVIEELACGHLKHRSEVIDLLHALPEAPSASHEEILQLILSKKLYGVGIGAMDVHLIASAMLARASLWTKDRALLRETSHLSLDLL
jgi:predicted nucleic acid-binding protein